MNAASEHITHCRLCGVGKLGVMFSLTATPPANAFVPAGELGQEQVCYPLDFCRCDNCGHMQLSEAVRPDILFRHYVYVSGTSSVMVDHLRRGADSAAARAKLVQGDFVLEFGSNDGTLLRFFQNMGMKVLGIDPAQNIAESATKAGVPTLADFFCPAVAASVRAQYGAPKLILANNVCAHIRDLVGVFEAVKLLLADDGLFIFEVGYLLDVMQNAYFDTIYHEHLDFHHVEPLVTFCARHGLEMVYAERIDIQGGSIRCCVRHSGGAGGRDHSVDERIQDERAYGLHLPQTYQVFGRRIQQRKDELNACLRGLKQQGKSIAAFGAPAKATTLLYHFGLTGDILEYIVDENPLKQGLYSPGMHIQVRPPDALHESTPDYLVVLAWNFAGDIMSRFSDYTAKGGRFIVPLPNLEIHGDVECV